MSRVAGRHIIGHPYITADYGVVARSNAPEYGCIAVDYHIVSDYWMAGYSP